MIMKDIETGVDRLVSLIAKVKNIDLNDAAKDLGVSESVVREWAEFLDEEGIISVEYGLSKVILSEKILTKKEAESKIKEYHSKKDAFVRKVETTLQILESETEEFDKIKAEFAELKNDIGSEMDDVKEELDELRHYEDLKHNIDNDIRRQKEQYIELIDNARKEIQFEEKKYSTILFDIGKEREAVAIEKKEILQIEEKEDHLRKRLEAMYGIIKSMENRLNQESDNIQDAETHIVRLESMADEITRSIEDKKKNIIEPLIEKSQQQAEKISIVQNAILEKVRKKDDKLDSISEKSKAISDKFSKFFDKKVRVESLLEKIDDDKTALEQELKELIRKAYAFDALAKKTNAKTYIADLLKTYDQIGKRKNLMRIKLDQLISIFKE